MFFNFKIRVKRGMGDVKRETWKWAWEWDR